jgi:hypothetical protein
LKVVRSTGTCTMWHAITSSRRWMHRCEAMAAGAVGDEMVVQAVAVAVGMQS